MWPASAIPSSRSGAWPRPQRPDLKRRLQVRALNTQRAYFLTATEHIGMVTTDGSLGVLATGAMTAETLRQTLQAMPDGTWELVCHPGYCDSSLKAAGTRLVESREVEREALLEVVPALPPTTSRSSTSANSKRQTLWR